MLKYEKFKSHSAHRQISWLKTKALYKYALLLS